MLECQTHFITTVRERSLTGCTETTLSMAPTFIPLKRVLPIVVLVLPLACADNAMRFSGVLEHRPEGKDGMWVISGQSFSVTDDVDLDEYHGPLATGTCVRLAMRETFVTEIASVSRDICDPATS